MGIEHMRRTHARSACCDLMQHTVNRRRRSKKADLHEKLGFPVKALGKIIEDFDEAGSNGFSLCFRILQALYLRHSALQSQQSG